MVGSAPGTGAEILLQPREKTMVKQVVPVRTTEDHIRADIYTIDGEDPKPKQGG